MDILDKANIVYRHVLIHSMLFQVQDNVKHNVHQDIILIKKI
jgi:hypothetical protein